MVGLAALSPRLRLRKSTSCNLDFIREIIDPWADCTGKPPFRGFLYGPIVWENHHLRGADCTGKSLLKGFSCRTGGFLIGRLDFL